MEIYQTLRTLLFKLDAEKSHNFAQKILSYTRALPFGYDILLKSGGYESPHLVRNICGMDFYNPIGLAAGFDKGRLPETQRLFGDLLQFSETN